MIGIIYKLTDNSDKVYYGSTICTLNKRLSQHRYINNDCSSKIMDRDSMNIECLEQYYFDTDMDYKELFKKRESYYIRNFNCINERIPGRTKKEYQKEYMSGYRKEYYEENKESIALKQKEYFEKNKERIKAKFTCECGSIIRQDTKSRHNRSKKHQAFISQ